VSPDLDRPYGPRLQKLIAVAESLRAPAIFHSPYGWFVSLTYPPLNPSCTTVFRVENGRLRLMPRTRT
jgi:hypothetical protein